MTNQKRATAHVIFSGIDGEQILAVLEFTGNGMFAPGSIIEDHTTKAWKVQSYATGPPVRDQKETAVLIPINHKDAPTIGTNLVQSDG